MDGRGLKTPLTEKRGSKRFIVVNSHWHLDHVGGNAVYSDSTIIATERTREQLIKHKGAIENGTLQGPPAIVPLRVPDVGIVAPVTVAVGRYSVELHPVNEHSADSLVAFMPQEKLLLAGDTMEDTITFIAEPENLVQHYRNLAKMRSWGIARILPNHGDPEVIARGGYDLALIEVTRHISAHWSKVLTILTSCRCPSSISFERACSPVLSAYGGLIAKPTGKTSQRSLRVTPRSRSRALVREQRPARCGYVTSCRPVAFCNIIARA